MTITIDDRKQQRTVDFFTDYTLDLRYDSVGSTFSFSFYFNPDNPEHRFLAQVGQYQLARLYHGGVLLLTGFILSQGLNKSSEPEKISFGGYSVPGVLEDSNIPVTIYPLQSDGLTLKQIVEKLLKPFVIKYDIDPDVSSLMDQVYEKTTAEVTQKVAEYIVELATQKNIIVSHTANGRLLFTRAKTNKEPILSFESGLIGTSISLAFNGQAMHSPITVVKQADKDGGNAGQYSLKNPYVPESTTAFRPLVQIQSSGNDNDSEKAARNILAAELKNITLTITTDRWEVDGKMIQPNNTVSVLAPELFIMKRTLFFIESVSFVGDAKETTATLTCSLPEVYNGEYPTNIFGL